MDASEIKDASGTSFHRGDYFLDGCAAAKEDFALYAGLVAEARLFTDEQLTKIIFILNTNVWYTD